MVKRRQLPRRRKKKGSKRRLSKPQTIQYLLELGTLSGLRTAKEKTTNLLTYHWNWYSELARQRNEIEEELKKSLIQVCKPYELKKWQRVVKWKYGLHPLSTNGSLRYIGGRFNTGEDVNSEVPIFPGLYIAEDKDTALQEHLGQKPADKNVELSPLEIALTSSDSISVLSVSGKLDKVFDLTNKNSLKPFVSLIKNFSISEELKEWAKLSGENNPAVVTHATQLLDILLSTDWRSWPNNYDVPANSQIFGHLIYMAGIEGILYPSKFTGKLCLVIFPHNFPQTDSYIYLDDESPHQKTPMRVDANTWRVCDLEAREIIS